MEAEYARQIRSEGEEHAAKDAAKKNEMLRKKKDYARKLKHQVTLISGSLPWPALSFHQRPSAVDLGLRFRTVPNPTDLTDSSRDRVHFDRPCWAQYVRRPLNWLRKHPNVRKKKEFKF